MRYTSQAAMAGLSLIQVEWGNFGTLSFFLRIEYIFMGRFEHCQLYIVAVNLAGMGVRT